MKLQEYMNKKSLTLKGMEAKTGIDFRVLHRYLKGRSLPSLKNAYKIYLGSNKQVKLQDWFKE